MTIYSTIMDQFGTYKTERYMPNDINALYSIKINDKFSVMFMFINLNLDIYVRNDDISCVHLGFDCDHNFDLNDPNSLIESLKIFNFLKEALN